MTARDPLAAIRARLAEVTACWQAAESLAQIRASFADYLAEVGPRGAAMARPRPQPLAPALAGAWIGQGARRALYCHGGGFQIGGIASHASLIARLAEAGQARILAVEYRLAPEHRYPAAIDDAFAAYQWLLANGGAPAAIIGDSAGGALALQTAQRARDAGLPLPRSLVLLSPGSICPCKAAATWSWPNRTFSPSRHSCARWRAAIWDTSARRRPRRSGTICQACRPSSCTPARTTSRWTTRIRWPHACAAGGQVQLQVFPGMCHHFQIYEALAEAQESIDALGRHLRQD